MTQTSTKVKATNDFATVRVPAEYIQERNF